jgi:putative inorganic carbon (HCO3(-)) transporter
MIYFLGIILALLPTFQVRFNLLGLPTTLLEILLAVFLLFSLHKFDAKKIQNLGKINNAILAFVLAGIISVIISPEKARALGQLKAFIIEPILLFYAVVLLFKNKDLNIPLRFLFVSASLISLFGIVQYFTYLNLPMQFWGTGEEIERITSIFHHPNALALYLAPLFGFFFTLTISRYKLFKDQWANWLGLFLMAVALILTFSRGAWLAVVITLGWLLVRQFSWKQIALPAGLIVLILLTIPPVRERVLLGFNDPSSLVHMELWKAGFQTVIANPLFGNGLHGFTAFNVEYPHNIFLNFWIEMGLLGLISFASIIFFTFKQIKKTPSTLTLAAGVFLVTLILHGLVDHPYFRNDLSILFWFITALIYL